MGSDDRHDTGWGLGEARRVRLALYRQLGLASPMLLAACGGSEVADSDAQGGVTTNPSSGELTGAEDSDSADESQSGTDTMPSSTSEEPETSGADSESAEEQGEEPRLDVGPIPDTGALLCSQEWFDAESAEALYPDCYAGPEMSYAEVCVPLPEDQPDCASFCPDELCPGMDACVSGGLVAVCGPYFEDESHSCCVFTAEEMLPPIGRPFVVDGELRLACTEGRELAQELDARARHWLEMARGEHASVAAFARFIAQLQACAAPPTLVAAAIRAAADEVRHTQLALELASQLCGEALALGPLRIDGLRSRAGDDASLAAALRTTLLEGCIGETLAAHEAACLAARARDAGVAAALETIARDELRHAALAWRFVRWALAQDPSLREVVEQTFAGFEAEQMREEARHGVGVTRGEESAQRELLAFGCPSPQTRARWRATARAEILTPWRELL